MKRRNRFLANFLLVFAFAIAVPAIAFASDDGPQGGAKSGTQAPQPPPPPTTTWWILIGQYLI